MGRSPHADGGPAFLLSILVLACVAPSAVAQLAREDIAALRERGRSEGWTFTVGENPATRYGLESLCGTVVPPDWRDGARFDPMPSDRDQPSAFDWRDVNGRNYCTRIKNQADCGACWAFAACGVVESNILIQGGPVVDLSEQWLVSCTDAGSCSGGWAGNACRYMRCSSAETDPCGDCGAVLESESPYVAADISCGCPFEHSYCLHDWAFVGPEWDVPTTEQIKQAILEHGPVAVGISSGDAFHAYTGGVFNHDEEGSINHAVILVGWDDSQGSEGVWILRNSWTSGWGEGGYMRIEYGRSRVGFGALYVDYGESSVELAFDYPSGRPTVVPPDEPTYLQVYVRGVTGTPVPDTGRLHYWINGTSYSWTELDRISSDRYLGQLPARPCQDTIEWYVSIEEAVAGTATDPVIAPAEMYHTVVAAEEIVLFEDDFETDRGWTVESGADTGNWERAVPELVSGDAFVSQPGEDQSPDGTHCFVTGPLAGSDPGSYDVDGGPTRLISPVLDVEGVDAYVSYWRWFHISTEWDDALVVEVSGDDGASWVSVESVVYRQTWTRARWRVNDYVAPGPAVRVRFTLDDSPNNSLLEALIDDFRVVRYSCVAPPSCDDGILNQGEDRIDCGGPCPPCTCLDDATCANGQFCDGDEICDAYGMCQPGTALSCGDLISCTLDVCDEETDSCEHVPDDAFCADLIYCNGVERCDPVFGCVAGTAVDCDDGVACTTDLCYEPFESCLHLPDAAACDDGLFCTGAETCDAEAGRCVSSGDPCVDVSGTWCCESCEACEAYGTGDFDADGDVDLADGARFQACMGQSAPGPCSPGNLAGDGLIGLADYVAFERLLTGPGS